MSDLNTFINFMVWYRLGKPERDAKKEQNRIEWEQLWERLEIPGERQKLLLHNLRRLLNWYVGGVIIGSIAYAIITWWWGVPLEKYWPAYIIWFGNVIFFSQFRIWWVGFFGFWVLREKIGI
jgi:hypothetical protein